MKNWICTLLLVGTGLTGFASDGNQAAKDLGAKVRFMLPVGMTVKKDLFFGGIIIDPARFHGGFVTVCSTGRTFEGLGIGALSTGRPEAAHPAVIEITGEEGQGFHFWADDVLNLTVDGGNQITIKTALRDLTDANPNAVVGGIGCGHVAATVEVGGILTIPAKVRPGRYFATFKAHVEYL